jgi:hypothetical protein
MAVKEVIWQDGQGSTPGTNSGDKITLQADAWSGTQQVTVQTPENFGIFRAMNIVFYSSADSTKTATLKVTQEAATASLSPNTVVFQNTDTAVKTITLSTNISTASRISIALEGADASQFTLSALSALSGGKCTFTIKPNSVNSGSSSRNCSIRVKVGRLVDSLIPVEQLADEVVSTEYSNYRLDGAVYRYNGNLIGGGEVAYILPGEGELYVQGQVVRDKKVTYSSGKVETTKENVPSGNLIYYSIRIRDTSGDDRCWFHSSMSAGGFLQGDEFVVPSLGYTLYDGDDGELAIALSDKSVQSGETVVVGSDISIQKNIREGYSNYTSKSFPSRTISADGGTVLGTASAYGTCRYSSGATRTENVPMKFEIIGPSSWASIQSQTPGTAGTSLSQSSCTVKATANTSTTSSRSVSVSALPRLADGSTGGTEVGYFTVTQSAATPSLGTLYLRGSFVGFDEKFSVDAVDSVGRLFYDPAPTLQSSSLIKCSYEFTSNVVEASLATYNNLKARNNKGIIREGTINKIMINDLIDGVDAYVNLS